jgi:hypothetical protein
MLKKRRQTPVIWYDLREEAGAASEVKAYAPDAVRKVEDEDVAYIAACVDTKVPRLRTQ